MAYDLDARYRGARMREPSHGWMLAGAVVFAATAGWIGCGAILGIPADVSRSTDSAADDEPRTAGDGSMLDGDDGAEADARDGGLAREDTGIVDASGDVDAADADGGAPDARDDSDAGSRDATPAGDADAGGPSVGLEAIFTANVDSQPPDAGAAAISTPISTMGPNRLLVAVIVWGADHTDCTPVTVSGAGLDWGSGPVLYRTFPDGGSGGVQPGGAGVAMWTARSVSAIPTSPIQSVTATRRAVDFATMTLGVYSFSGASSGFGASGGFGDDNGGSYPLSVTLNAHATGSWIVGGFMGGVSGYLAPDPPLQKWDVMDNPANAQYNHFTATGSVQTRAPGNITIGSNFMGDFNVAAALEILPGS